MIHFTIEKVRLNFWKENKIKIQNVKKYFKYFKLIRN